MPKRGQCGGTGRGSRKRLGAEGDMAGVWLGLTMESWGQNPDGSCCPPMK